MRRLSTADKVLAATLVPLWAVSLVLAAVTALREHPYPHVMVRSAAEAEGFPSVMGFRPYALPDHDLRVGDRLVTVGGRDLRGAGAFAFLVEVLGASYDRLPLSVVVQRDGERWETALPVGPFGTLTWPVLPLSILFALVALVGFLRAPDSRMIRAGFLAFMLTAIAMVTHFGGSRPLAVAGLVLMTVSFALTPPLLLRALLFFPMDTPPRTLWGRLGPWLLLPGGILFSSVIIGAPLALPPRVGYPLGLAFGLVVFGAGLGVAARNYLRADPVGRRRMKWVLYGSYVGLAPAVTCFAIALYDPRFTMIAWHSVAAACLIPIGLLVAVVRANLFDIDRLISATAAYNLALVGLAALGLLVVPRAAGAASDVLGVGEGTGQVALSLILAAVVIPVQRRLRPRLEQIFFAERHAIDRGLDELLHALSGCRDGEALLELLGGRLNAIFRPEACALYARREDAYVPIFAEGRAMPPAFQAGGALAAALGERKTALVAARFAEDRSLPPLDPFDRAALETLAAAVVLPLRPDDALWGFLCLGPKRSADVYTPTDLRLLRAVVEKASSELRRFDREGLLAEAEAMQESLRRYVPGAIAHELASGSELDAGERDVSVLFVDIRGYSRLSEGRRASDVFSTVNRYTETVSEIVAAHGGAVVEFNGDGMMAVFGAPRELEAKERAAVLAGREIVARAGEIFVETGAGTEPLSVGVGVATGEAFVGNIRAVDRLIWSAIGNTTNLAARLQGLTRDLDAALVIDAVTWQALGGSGHDFERCEATAIRGRQRPEDVYVLRR